MLYCAGTRLLRRRAGGVSRVGAGSVFRLQRTLCFDPHHAFTHCACLLPRRSCVTKAPALTPAAMEIINQVCGTGGGAACQRTLCRHLHRCQLSGLIAQGTHTLHRQLSDRVMSSLGLFEQLCRTALLHTVRTVAVHT